MPLNVPRKTYHECDHAEQAIASGPILATFRRRRSYRMAVVVGVEHLLGPQPEVLCPAKRTPRLPLSVGVRLRGTETPHLGHTDTLRRWVYNRSPASSLARVYHGA